MQAVSGRNGEGRHEQRHVVSVVRGRVVQQRRCFCLLALSRSLALSAKGVVVHLRHWMLRLWVGYKPEMHAGSLWTWAICSIVNAFHMRAVLAWNSQSGHEQ